MKLKSTALVSVIVISVIGLAGCNDSDLPIAELNYVSHQSDQPTDPVALSSEAQKLYEFKAALFTIESIQELEPLARADYSRWHHINRLFKVNRGKIWEESRAKPPSPKSIDEYNFLHFSNLVDEYVFSSDSTFDEAFSEFILKLITDKRMVNFYGETKYAAVSDEQLGEILNQLASAGIRNRGIKSSTSELASTLRGISLKEIYAGKVSDETIKVRLEERLEMDKVIFEIFSPFVIEKNIIDENIARAIELDKIEKEKDPLLSFRPNIYMLPLTSYTDEIESLMLKYESAYLENDKKKMLSYKNKAEEKFNNLRIILDKLGH